jgi:hypothetical protein
MSRVTQTIRDIRRRLLPKSPSDVIRHYDANTSVKGALVPEGNFPSRELVDRIKRFYARSQTAGNITHDIWADIDQKRKPIHDALLASDNSAIDLLSSPENTFLFYGMDTMHPGNDVPISGMGIIEYDSLERLSEALGTRRKFYNESILNGHRHRRFDVDGELDLICKKLGIDGLKIPNPFRNAYGLDTARGVLDYRSVQAIYQAWRIMQFRPSTVAEIGGGLGRTAAFAIMMGVPRYTIFDIPLTTVAQALFLGLTFGEYQIRLSGETDDGQRIQLLQPHEFKSAKFDIALNVDSMTEMSKVSALSYIDAIKRNGAPFISINHEFNKFTVSDLFGEPRLRHPYWMRKGYVEELF